MENYYWTLLVVFFSLHAFSQAEDICGDPTRLDSKLTCGVYVDGMPEGEIGIHISGKAPTQESKTLVTKNGRYRAEVAWDGYFGGVPRNPELRVQLIDPKDDTIIVESYKNFDLQKMEKGVKKTVTENDDNVGLRTAKEVIYLSCNYQKTNNPNDCPND